MHLGALIERFPGEFDNTLIPVPSPEEATSDPFPFWPFLVPLEDFGCEFLEGIGHVLSLLVDLVHVRCSISMCTMNLR